MENEKYIQLRNDKNKLIKFRFYLEDDFYVCRATKELFEIMEEIYPEVFVDKDYRGE